MKFNLRKSKLLFEVRYKMPDSKECYTYEMLYKTVNGKYFIHFETGKYSQYAIKVGMFDYMARSGDYWIDKFEIEIWKEMALNNFKNKPEKYMVIDWEQEEEEAILHEIELNDEYIMAMGKLNESELPF